MLSHEILALLKRARFETTKGARFIDKPKPPLCSPPRRYEDGSRRNSGTVAPL